MAHIRIIKRGGNDGAKFPLSKDACITLGVDGACDIRVKMANVDKIHTKIIVKNDKTMLKNLSTSHPTFVNGVPVVKEQILQNGDIFTIIDRNFRYQTGAVIQHELAMEKENLSTPPPAKRRKSIKFGPDLTPEEIDKKLPPTAPVSRGRTPPRRGSTGFSILKGGSKSQPTPAGVLLDHSPEKLPETVTEKEEIKASDIPLTPKSSSTRRSVRKSAGMKDLTVIKGQVQQVEAVEKKRKSTKKSGPISENVVQEEPENITVPSEDTTVPMTTDELSLDISQLSDVLNLNTTSASIIAQECVLEQELNDTHVSDIIDLDSTESLDDESAVNIVADTSCKSDILNLDIISPTNVSVSSAPSSSTPASSTHQVSKDKVMNLLQNMLTSPQFVNKNLTVARSEDEKNVNIYIVNMNISSNNDIIPDDSRKRKLEEEEVEETLCRVDTVKEVSISESESSSDDDNIVIYNTTDEDLTDLDYSMVTEPGDDSLATESGINTTIDDFISDPTPQPKRKSVRFGPHLTPEIIDKELPANTPIRKGAMPFNKRFSVPNPQHSAGRTPGHMRKSVAVCGTPVEKLNLDDSVEDSNMSALTAGLSHAIKTPELGEEARIAARTARRKTMTPKEVKANIAWCEIDQDKRLSTPVLKMAKTKTSYRSSCRGQINTPAADMTSPRSSSPTESSHLDSPIVKETPRTKLKAHTIPLVLEETEEEGESMDAPPEQRKVFGKTINSAKTPVSAKMCNPALSRLSPPTPLPFKGVTVNTKPKSLHEQLQRATARKATMTAQVEPAYEDEDDHNDEVEEEDDHNDDVEDEDDHNDEVKDEDDHNDEVEEEKLEQEEAVQDKDQSEDAIETEASIRSIIEEKRKSINAKRKSLGLKPKTWASVASKLQDRKSPFKKAGAGPSIVKLPAKTPLRARAIRALEKDTSKMVPVIRMTKKSMAAAAKTAATKTAATKAASAKAKSVILKPVIKLKSIAKTMITPTKRTNTIATPKRSWADMVRKTAARKTPFKETKCETIAVPPKTPLAERVQKLQGKKKPVTKSASPQTKALSGETLSRLFETPKGTPQAKLLSKAIVRLSAGKSPVISASDLQTEEVTEEVIEEKFSNLPTPEESVPLDELEFVLCNEEGTIKEEIDIDELCELFSDDYKPDNISTLCAALTPIVQHQWTKDNDFDFGTLKTVLKETENEVPEVDPFAMRKIFKTPKKSVPSGENVDPIALMKLFLCNSNFKQNNEEDLDSELLRSESELDTEALSNQLNQVQEEPIAMRLLYKTPKEDGTILDEEKVEAVLTGKVRNSIAPGDLCRLFTIQDLHQSDEMEKLLDELVELENTFDLREVKEESNEGVLLEDEKEIDNLATGGILKEMAAAVTEEAGDVENIVEEDVAVAEKLVSSPVAMEAIMDDIEDIAECALEDSVDVAEKDGLEKNDRVIDTLCAVITPIIRRRWSIHKTFDFGSVAGVLKHSDLNTCPEVDPYAMRKMFKSPKQDTEDGPKQDTSTEDGVDAVALIKLLLNPDLCKNSIDNVELDPVAFQQLFNDHQVVDNEPSALVNKLVEMYKDEERDPLDILYRPHIEESVLNKVLSKTSRNSILPGDLCRLFATQKQKELPNISGLEELFESVDDTVLGVPCEEMNLVEEESSSKDVAGEVADLNEGVSGEAKDGVLEKILETNKITEPVSEEEKICLATEGPPKLTSEQLEEVSPVIVDSNVVVKAVTSTERQKIEVDTKQAKILERKDRITEEEHVKENQNEQTNVTKATVEELKHSEDIIVVVPVPDVTVEKMKRSTRPKKAAFSTNITIQCSNTSGEVPEASIVPEVVELTSTTVIEQLAGIEIEEPEKDLEGEVEKPIKIVMKVTPPKLSRRHQNEGKDVPEESSIIHSASVTEPAKSTCPVQKRTDRVTRGKKESVKEELKRKTEPVISEVIPELEPVTKLVTMVKKPKKRGRPKGKKQIVEQDPNLETEPVASEMIPEPEPVAELESLVESVEAPKRRGRHTREKKQVVEEEPNLETEPVVSEMIPEPEPVAELESLVESVEAPKRRGRHTREKKQVVEEEPNLETEPVVSEMIPEPEPVAELESLVEPVEVPKRSGRQTRGKKQIIEEEPNLETEPVEVLPGPQSITEHVTMVEPAKELKKRGRRTREKKQIVKQFNFEETEPVVSEVIPEPVTELATLVDSVEAPKRRGRHTRVKYLIVEEEPNLETEPVIPEPQSITELESLIESVEVPKRRGRYTRGKKKIVEEEPNLETEPLVSEMIPEPEPVAELETVVEPAKDLMSGGRTTRGKKKIIEDVFNRETEPEVSEVIAENELVTMVEPAKEPKRATRGKRGIIQNLKGETEPITVPQPIAESEPIVEQKRRGRQKNVRKVVDVSPDEPKIESELQLIAKTEAVEKPNKTSRSARGGRNPQMTATIVDEVIVKVAESVQEPQCTRPNKTIPVKATRSSRSQKLSTSSLYEDDINDLPAVLDILECVEEPDISEQEAVPASKTSRSTRGQRKCNDNVVANQPGKPTRPSRRKLVDDVVEQPHVTFAKSIAVSGAESTDLKETATPSRSSRQTHKSAEETAVTPSQSSRRTPRKTVENIVEEVMSEIVEITPSRTSKRSRKNVKSVEEQTKHNQGRQNNEKEIKAPEIIVEEEKIPRRRGRRAIEKEAGLEDLRLVEEELRVAELMLKELSSQKLKRGIAKKTIQDDPPPKRPKRAASKSSTEITTKPVTKSKPAIKSKPEAKSKAKAKKVVAVVDETSKKDSTEQNNIPYNRLSIIIEENECPPKRSARRRR